MTTLETAKNAVKTQIHLLTTIHCFEKLGFIVEPTSTNEDSNHTNIANQLYSALTSNSDIIYDVLCITDENNKECFDTKLHTLVDTSNVGVEKIINRLFQSHYGELRNNYTDEDENEVYIDAWKTADDNEEGTVIAKINTKTYKVTYLDVNAMTDTDVQELIQDTIRNLQTT